MQEVAYRNGEVIPATDLSVSVSDTGFKMGVTVSEQLRTFGGRLFRTDEHWRRFERSIAIVGLTGLDLEALSQAAQRLVAHNLALLDEGEELGLTVFATPGVGIQAEPTVCIHTARLPVEQWAHRYSRGESLVVSKVRQVPPTCWPPELKCRSRMHYFLADQEARSLEPGARAVLLDQDGFVSEASTASVLMFRRDEGLTAPDAAKVLPSISVGVIESLADAAGIPLRYQDFRIESLRSADEVLLSSTSPCVLPVTRVDGQPVGTGYPGAVFQTLIRAWSDLVGIDIVAHACGQTRSDE